MPGQYLTNCRVRPHSSGCKRAEETPARFFLCARCRAQVLICRCCDRGQIYCSGGCAQEARRSGRRAANKRYQASYRGRMHHAARAQRYRARKKKVTDQGMPQQPSDALVTEGWAGIASKPRIPECVLRASAWQCHWCGCRCPAFVRQEFLPHRRAPRISTRRGPDRDHFP
jgi:hypothetical protein